MSRLVSLFVLSQLMVPLLVACTTIKESGGYADGTESHVAHDHTHDHGHDDGHVHDGSPDDFLFDQNRRVAQARLPNYKDPIFSRYPLPDKNSKKYRVRGLRVTVLSDMAVQRDTRGEWGYAALVEGRDAAGTPFTLLFDTGADPDTVLFNMQKLKDPDHPDRTIAAKVCAAENVLISHNHQDHTAGLLTLRAFCKQTNPRALSKAWLGGAESEWPRPRQTPAGGSREGNYLLSPSREPGPAKGRTVRETYEALGGKFIMAETPREIFKGVWTTGKIFRKTNERMFWQFGSASLSMRDPGSGSLYNDDVPEDHGLVINTDAGIIVMTGCGHAGVVNTAVHAAQYVIHPEGGNRVVAVIGGIHSFPSTSGEVNFVADSFRKLGVQYIVGSHCTGFEALVHIRDRIRLHPTRAVIGAVGTILETGGSNGPLTIRFSPGQMINRHNSEVKR